MIPFRRTLLAFACALLLPGSARGEAPAPAAFHADFARHGGATAGGLPAARAALGPALDSLARAAEARPITAARLLRIVRGADRVADLGARIGDELHLRAALDTRDEAPRRAEDSVSVALDRASQDVRAALAGADSAALVRFEREEPALAPYRAYLAGQRRLALGRPAPGVAELGSLATSWPFALYQLVLNRTDFGTVTGPAGPLDVRRQRIAIAASPDSALRAEGARRLAEGYARSRDLFAFTLLQTVAAQNAVARAHGRADRPAEAYAERGLTTGEVRALVGAVRAHGSLLRRYQAATARARRALEGVPPPRVTPAEVGRAMAAAFAPLGPVREAEIARLYDPAEGLLELGPGGHRQAGGFSFRLPDGTHGVYLDGFEGYPADVRRLVHESGHALHRRGFELAGGPAVEEPALGEVVAQFGEILVADHLAAGARRAADRIAWRQVSLRTRLEVFLGAQDAELEQAIYDEAAAGRLRSADDLDALTARVDSAYTEDRTPGAAGRWMRVSLLVEDPLYLSNYLYSGLVVAALDEGWQADAQGLARRYAAFLLEPGSKPVAEAVRALGLSLDDPTLPDRVARHLEGEVARFEAEVAALDGRR